MDLGPLRESRDFRLLWSGQLVSMVGTQITAVAVPFQVFLLTGSTLAIGVLGLCRLAALLATGLFAGVLADRYDRKLILMGATTGQLLCSTSLAAVTAAGARSIWPVVLIATVSSGLGSVSGPARSAIIPAVVSRERLPAALALNLGLFHLGGIAGPPIAGVVIGVYGLTVAYTLDAATYVVSLGTQIRLRSQPAAHAMAESAFRSIAAGVRHISDRRVILGTFALDLDAMIFGLPIALFPALAADTFHAGSVGLGLLYAAPSAGGVLALAFTGWFARARHLGRIFQAGVFVWGVAMAMAGLSQALWLTLGFLAIAGGVDAIGVVGRTTIMQEETPDNFRGRVSAAYSMVVGGGPYIGQFESGAVAQAFSPEVSFVSGGIACSVLALVVARIFPEVWTWRRTAATEHKQPSAT